MKVKVFRRFFRRRKRNPRELLLTSMPKNSVCAEIGVHKGDFSEKILNIVKPKKLHLIDPWKYESGGIYQLARYGGKACSQEVMDERYEKVVERFKSEIEKGQVVIHRGPSSEVSKEFQDSYFDWVYIDGNHLYEFVKKDLELYCKKVKRGGFLAGDDYVEGGWWQGGVKKAVDEFIDTGLVKIKKIERTQFILKKI